MKPYQEVKQASEKYRWLQWVDAHPVWVSLFFLLTAAFVRALHLDLSNVWVDEAYSIFWAQHPPLDIAKETLATADPPFFEIMTHFWIKIFGISEAGARSFPVTLSALVAPMLFLAGRKWIGPLAGITAASIFILNTTHNHYAHDVRHTTGVIFFSMISLMLWKRTVETKSWKAAAGLSLVNAMMIFTHYLSAVVPLTQGLMTLLWIGKGWKHVFAGMAGLAGSLLLLLPLVLYLGKMPGNPGWIPTPEFSEVISAFENMCASKMMMAVGLCSALLVLIHSFSYGVRSDQFRTGMSLLIFMFFPALFVFAYSQFNPVFQSKYLLFSSLSWFLVIGYAVVILARHFVLTMVIPVALTALAGWKFDMFVPKSEDWEKTARWVEAHQTPTTLVIGIPYYMGFAFCYYYQDGILFRDIERYPFNHMDFNSRWEWEVNAILNYDYTGFDKLILVQGQAGFLDTDEAALNQVKAKFRFEERADFLGVRVTTFKIAPPVPQ